MCMNFKLLTYRQYSKDFRVNTIFSVFIIHGVVFEASCSVVVKGVLKYGILAN